MKVGTKIVVHAGAGERLPGTSTWIRDDGQQADIVSVVQELRDLGLDVRTGDVTLANKPTINSNNGG